MEIEDPIDIAKNVLSAWKNRRKYERKNRRERAKKQRWLRVGKVLFWVMLIGYGVYSIGRDLAATAQILSQPKYQVQIHEAETLLRNQVASSTEGASVYLLSERYSLPLGDEGITERTILKTDQPLGFESDMVVMPSEYAGRIIVEAGMRSLAVKLGDKTVLIIAEDKLK